MCVGWGKYPNGSEWELGRVQIMLQTPLSVPLENTNNLYKMYNIMFEMSLKNVSNHGVSAGETYTSESY